MDDSETCCRPDQPDDGRDRAALDVRGTPGLQPRGREDDGGVGDVFDDARRGRPDRDRLQRQQVAVDHADCSQTGVQAERCTADRSKAEPHGRRRLGAGAAGGRRVVSDGRYDQTFYRRQDFAQRQVHGQCDLGQPAVGKDGDPHDGYDSAGHHRLLRILGDIASLSLVNDDCSGGQTVCGLVLVKSRESRLPSNQWPSGSWLVSCSTATATANGGSGAERGDPFAVERTRRADQHPAHGGVDDAHAHFGAGVPPVVVAARDDLHVAARPGEHRFDHRTRRLRDAQVIKDFGERRAVAQPLVSPRTDLGGQAEFVESCRRTLRQPDTENRHQRAGVVNIHRRERDELRITQCHNSFAAAPGDDPAQQILAPRSGGRTHIAQVQPPIRKAHHPNPVGYRPIDDALGRHHAQAGQFGGLGCEERTPFGGISVWRGDRQHPRKRSRSHGFSDTPRLVDGQLDGVGLVGHLRCGSTRLDPPHKHCRGGG